MSAPAHAAAESNRKNGTPSSDATFATTRPRASDQSRCVWYGTNPKDSQLSETSSADAVRAVSSESCPSLYAAPPSSDSSASQNTVGSPS